jgi:hypothetical protein
MRQLLFEEFAKGRVLAQADGPGVRHLGFI